MANTMLTDAMIEAAARASAAADGLDYDEVCGKETDADECDSGTCVAAYSEDHDADDCRGWYRRQARAALTAALPLIRAQVYLAGVKAGLDAAAERADELFFGGEDESVATVIANEIRAIDPASVGADHDA